MLDSKNKVYQNIVKNMNQSGGNVPSETETNMREINEKFSKVSDLSSQWEQVNFFKLFYVIYIVCDVYIIQWPLQFY